VKGTDVYPHMPILYEERRISSATFTSAHLYGNIYTARWPIRLILGFWGSKVRRNLWFPALHADEPPCKMWRR